MGVTEIKSLSDALTFISAMEPVGWILIGLLVVAIFVIRIAIKIGKRILAIGAVVAIIPIVLIWFKNGM